MRVLYLVNIPSPYRVDFFNELGKYCRLTVLYERSRANGREWKVKTIRKFEEVYLKGWKLGEDTAFSFEIIKYLREKVYDVIVIGGYGTITGMLAIEYLKLKKIPFILNCDGGVENPTNILKRVLKKHFISASKYYLSPAQVTDEFLIKYGANEKNIFRYPFTSVCEKDILKNIKTRNEKLKLREELGWDNKFILITVGRILYLKGYDNIVQACKNHYDKIEVYIVGGEPTQELIELMNETRASNIHFVKFQDHDALNKYYQAADAFVFSTRGDVWGLVVNEAMANGLPIISSDKAVASLELVKENGFIYNCEDIKELEKRILFLRSSPDMCKSMGKKSLEIIKEYTIEKMAKCHFEIFEFILRERE